MKLIFLIFLTTISLSATANEPNLFEDTIVGFKVQKPNDWHFITTEQNHESLKRLNLKDESLHQRMLKYSTAPLVVMMKYKEPYNDLNPSFKVNIKPLGKLKNIGPKQILNLLIPQFKKMFHNFKLSQIPIDTKISNLPAAYMRIDYSLPIPDGRVFPTTSEMWIVPRGKYFFIIGAGTHKDEKTGKRAEISKIISSVEL